MFGKRISLFKLLGFEVRLDYSWVIIALLIAWSLSSSFFPLRFKGLSTVTYWVMGVAGTLALFLSIIFHELSHSFVARKYGIPIKGITLFLFGGVAEMSDEPPSPKAEFMMAVAGPAASVALGLGLRFLFGLGRQWLWPNALNGVIAYVSLINFLLAGFNLMPGFPLDGGRILRALLWGAKKDLRWATRISSIVGICFGALLIIFGFYNVFKGDFVSGMWWFLIGMFLQSAARASYQQVLSRQEPKSSTLNM
ncbi:MAG: site-2 protease family protein [Deltaproteobacteria bacterium]|nr:site-2 protease family protein [Deltaproteobacteria bacterium]MBW1918924.1 site-2 protease family protein [Deltaproteobacteria bacterium]MBW1935540.1 site-2 protease family protein [Deltaproteobacteria bacterium]MBW1977227.1 site-2 protease family protein [Deltaproteobacteria bacterium]MBW2044365.1 site-2 protease family protein [Deltaproteobacteria bacterium]